MANAVRVRVELKSKYLDPRKNFNEMLQEFRRRVNNSGIMHDYKDHQFYESDSEKDRKKKRDAKKKFQLEAIEDKLRKGEPIKASQGLIKKVLSGQKKDKDKDKKKKNKDYTNNKGGT